MGKIEYFVSFFIFKAFFAESESHRWKLELAINLWRDSPLFYHCQLLFMLYFSIQ